MKKSVRILTLLLVLSMTLCLLPAAAADDPEWVYRYKKHGTETYQTVQVGAYPNLKTAQAALDAMRSYGYEAFIFNDGKHCRVCVGLYDAATKADDSKILDAIKDFKTLTRADDSLYACCGSFMTAVTIPADEAKKFSGFGGSAPAATATPKRTSIEVQEPEELYKDGSYCWIKFDRFRRLYGYYEPDNIEESGIAGYVTHGEKVNLIGHTGKWSLIELKNGTREWTLTAYLWPTDPNAKS